MLDARGDWGGEREWERYMRCYAMLLFIAPLSVLSIPVWSIGVPYNLTCSEHQVTRQHLQRTIRAEGSCGERRGGTRISMTGKYF